MRPFFYLSPIPRTLGHTGDSVHSTYTVFMIEEKLL